MNIKNNRMKRRSKRVSTN